MNCERVRLLLNAYLDDELDLVTSLDLEGHLKTCADCSREYETLLSLRAAIHNNALRHIAPASLEKRIRSSLKQAAPNPKPWLIFQTTRFAPALALFAILLLASGYLLRGVIPARQDTAIAEDVQSAHLRSLLADHLLDVVSTDQHTVKPWFDGKLDFSPPVTDLAAEGFPLTGGRLDYLGGHPAAALVYMRYKHTINLFIWPSPGTNTAPMQSTHNGYNLIQWTRNGMAYWAISDLNSEELLAFVEAFQKGTQ